MLTVMDMSTGRIIEEEFGAFEDEVLNAGWMPSPEVPQLGLQTAEAAHAAPAFNADTFLHDIYLCQE